MSTILQQIGQDIDGEAQADQSGYSVSMNANGTRVAIGAVYNDGTGTDSGHVRVYEYNGSAWSKMGADIDGEAIGDLSGVSVSMNADGTRVAIGALANSGNVTGSVRGHVRVYNWSGSAWSKMGADIDGEATNDMSGSSVSLSADGTRVAIGAEDNDGGGTNSGHVRVYNWSGTSWSKMGADIDGEAAGDKSGVSVSLSGDGTRMAIGAYQNDGTTTNLNDSRGHVRVYNWSGSAWVKIGQDIDGEAAADYSGVSVSMNALGTRVAIGANQNDGNGANSGHVRVYEYNTSTLSWVQIGADIDGEASGDQSGYSVSMNADGTCVAIGANQNDGTPIGSNRGHVRVYNWSGSAWVKIGQDIDGENANDQSGWSVSLSADGTRVAIGAIHNDGPSSTTSDNRGHVRVYSLPAPITIPGVPTGVSAVPGNAQAVVSFTAPTNNGGAAITGYTVTSSPGNFTATGAASPLTVTGLTNGTAYTFTVVATNSAGTGGQSTASSAVTPRSVPGVPTGVYAVAGNTEATVSFVPPTNNGGAAITGYTVTSSPGNFTATATGAASPLTVTGLTNGTTYTFTVVATNSAGTSVSSAASASVTPASNEVLELQSLGAISNISTYLENIAELNISNGGVINFVDLGANFSELTEEDKKITSKKLIKSVFDAKPQLKNFIVKKEFFPITSSNANDNILVVKVGESVTLTNQLNSTTSLYVGMENINDMNTFTKGTTVFAITKTVSGYFFTTGGTTTSYFDGNSRIIDGLLIVFGGVSISSALAPSITATVDTTTTLNHFIVTATPTTGPSIRPVTSYTMTVTPPVSTGFLPITYTGASSEHVFSDVYSGINYTITVVAVSDIGVSNTVTLSNVRFANDSRSNPAPCNYPTPPVATSGPGYRQITLSFYTSPSDTVNRYIFNSEPSVNFPSLVNTTHGVLTQHILSNLTIGQDYTFTIYSKNELNTGSTASIWTSPVQPLNVIPPVITSPLTVGDGTLNVSFTPQPQDSAITPTNYTIALSASTPNAVIPPSQTVTVAQAPIGVSHTKNFSGLSNGVIYTATVTINATSNSVPVSSSSTATGIPNGPPGAPTNVTIITGALDNQLIVTYNLSSAPSTYVTGYDIILTPSGGSPLPAINVSSTTTQVFINPTTQTGFKLIAGKSYSVIVRAKSANGNTESSPASGTPLGDAEPATITSVDADNKKITVNFNASATPSEHLESYIVVLTPSGGSNLVSVPIPATSASTYSYTFEGLTNYIVHTAKVIAGGNGNLVNNTTIISNTLTASATGPDAPTLVSAEPDEGKAFVYFVPSIVPVGGSLIKEYTATSSPGGFTATGSASPLLVEGLSNGTSYTFTVVAKNNLGKVSVASEPSLGVIPTSVPDAPTLVSAVAGDGEVTITFTTPFDGGSEIEGYSVFSVQNGGFVRSLPAFSSPFVYGGLENGQKYSFSVCANNDKGTSESSNSLEATPASLAILDILNINARVIPDVSIFMNSIDALDIAERGDLVRFANLGVDFSALTTNDHKKKITKKIANLLFQEKTHLKHFKIKKSLFPIVSSNAKDDIIVVKANDEPFEIEKLDSTTSIYVGIEKLGDHNTFIIGSDEFAIEKTANGYDFTYNNTTTSHIDGAETRVNDLLIVFGGGSISFDPFNQALPCYARGTLIGTSRGWVPIENLLISDKLRTYDRIEENMFKPVHGSPFKTLVRVKDTRYKNKFGDIKFIGKFTVDMMHENTAPIRITAGSLGPSKPEIDLLVSPNHSMLVGNRLIFAKFLVNGSTIYQDMSFKKIEYFHVLSDNHYIINANGALSETLGSEELGLFHSLHSCSDKIENIDIKDNGMLAY
jgi:hypothetical protein